MPIQSIETYACFCATILFQGLLLYLPYQQVFADGEGMKCAVVLDGSDLWEDANEQCIKTNNVDETTLDNLSLNMTLDEYDFDDNCFIQCVYTKVGILTPEGLVNRNETSNIFKGNMTAEMLEMSTSIWNFCIDESEKVAKSKNANPCKTVSLHDFCFSKRVLETGILEIEC